MLHHNQSSNLVTFLKYYSQSYVKSWKWSRSSWIQIGDWKNIRIRKTKYKYILVKILLVLVRDNWKYFAQVEGGYFKIYFIHVRQNFLGILQSNQNSNSTFRKKKYPSKENILHTRKRKFSSVDSKIFSQAKIQTPKLFYVNYFMLIFLCKFFSSKIYFILVRQIRLG